MRDIAARGGKLLSQMRGKRVLVVGDLMIDEYIWGAVTRISPEAPVPVVGVTGETLRLGGAANVANNIISLGGQVELCGVLGDDQMGRWLRKDLEERGVGIRGIITTPRRPTTVKTRVIAHEQQVVRVDKEVTTSIGRSDERLLIGSAGSFINDCGCVVISDYAKGVTTPTLIQDLISLSRRTGVPIAVDPKIVHFSTYRNVTVLTPNLLEAAAGSGMIIDSIDALIKAGRKIFKKLNCESLLITRGDQGMTLFNGPDDVTHIATDSRSVHDVTGAGDTVISTLSLALAGGLSMMEAAYLANAAAGVVVGEIGTVPISADRMSDRLRDLAARST